MHFQTASNLILSKNLGCFCVPHTYHVSAIHRGGHLDLPEVLSLRQLLVPADGGRATAVLHVEIHLAVVTRQQRGRRLVQVIPHPVKIC